ncbi:MAG: DNA mismatch repair protein MutS [Oscillospiraceae bacterium]|jgi:DNA mismatch repair protein MutS|nr:DNA mismatch repair protein MutS [Oscillospiraceae bacterium]
MTPMMQQWKAVKAQNPDAILLYRLGDFYEMFFEDAKTVSAALDLTLTGRDCGEEERAPMCGIPYFAAEGYIAKLVAKGFKLAVCEQMEDPASTKGLVKREVIRVISPGTLIEPSMLDEGKNNYICGLYLAENGAGLVFADVSTGTAQGIALGEEDLQARIVDELCRFQPAEIIWNPAVLESKRIKKALNLRLQAATETVPDEDFDYENAKAAIAAQFAEERRESLDLELDESIVRAMGALLLYLAASRPGQPCGLRDIECNSERLVMRIEAASRRNLELTETQRSREKKGSLLWVIDHTKTPMGKRLLRSWTEAPLTHLPRITKRQAAVAELVQNAAMLQDGAMLLTRIHDMERGIARVTYQSCNARDLLSLADSFAVLPEIKMLLSSANAAMLRDIQAAVDPLRDMENALREAIVEQPPVTIREGGMIRPGYYKELDDLHRIVEVGNGGLGGIQEKERNATGIQKLKVGYNRVFGYYIEIPNSNRIPIPAHYIRKQTLSNCERYITQGLKDLESKVLGAKDRINTLEYEIFTQLRDKLAANAARVRKTAAALAVFDSLLSLAETAVRENYCRPVITPGDAIIIKDGRHPVVEKMLGSVPFVPNDTELGSQGMQCAIVTGPNMAGKSTYMRQVALIVLLAQMGSFVPAASADIGICDAIFTRVGASDDLAAGQSTFMTEMSEVARILRTATKKSLVIFDEIGRGTATYDGMAIARAVLEYVTDPKRIGAKTLFATHYHELTALEGHIPGVFNCHAAVKRRGEEITFLRRITRGAADGSYGVEVAKLAGVPDMVVRRARQYLKEVTQEREGGGIPVSVGSLPAPAPGVTVSDEESMTGIAKNALFSKLRHLDAESMTPIEALTMLYNLTAEAKAIGA